MKKTNDWINLRYEIVEILKEAEHHYHSENYVRSCFLSAYQLAVLLNRKNRTLITNSSCPRNIGGKGEGSFDSLSRYIANMLAKDLGNDIEMEFFSINGLQQFSFLDEKNIISQPSNTCFSMFRYIK